MSKSRRALLVVSVVLACVCLDQSTKAIIKSHLPGLPASSYFGDTLRIQYAENEGAFLSLGSSLPERYRSAVFVGGVAAILGLVLIYVLSASGISTSAATAFSFVLGGGLSNLLDRILHSGRVVDFLNLGIGGVRTGIFNVADLAIMAGMLMLVFTSFRQEKDASSGKGPGQEASRKPGGLQ